MKKSKIKYIFELVFIFVLPLLFIVCCFNIQKQYTYDNNGNFETSNYTLVFNSPIDLTTTEERTGTYETFNYNNYVQVGEARGEYYDFTHNEEGFIVFYDSETYYEPAGVNIDRIVLSYSDYRINQNNKILQIYFNVNLYNGNNLQDNFDDILLYSASNFDTGSLRALAEPSYEDTTYLYVSIEEIEANTQEYLNSYLFQDKWEDGEIDLGNYYARVEYAIKWDYIEHTYTYIEETENINLFGKIENLICNTLQISNNIVLDILIVYTFLWFIMFIIWHLFYLTIDFLLHFWKKEDD